MENRQRSMIIMETLKRRHVSKKPNESKLECFQDTIFKSHGQRFLVQNSFDSGEIFSLS